MTDLREQVERLYTQTGRTPSAEQVERVVKDIERTDAAVREADKRLPHRATRFPFLGLARVTGIVPVGESGEWRVKRVTVSPQDEDLERLRSLLSSSSRGRWTPAGEYTMLMHGSTTVMSDTPDELFDLLDLHYGVRDTEARRVLVNGLGLGCALLMLMREPTVEHIDVVELSEDVITLVAPTMQNQAAHRFVCDSCGRVDLIGYPTGDQFFCCQRTMRRAAVELRIHQDNAYTIKWPPNTRWDVAWHDIWNDISTGNDFTRLHRRYGGRVRWQASWGRDNARVADKLWRRENAWWLEEK